jgi:hypothetical protein
MNSLQGTRTSYLANQGTDAREVCHLAVLNRCLADISAMVGHIRLG